MTFCKTSQFSWKSICNGVSFRKALSPHVCKCTKNDAFTGVFLWIDFVNTIFFGSFHSSIHSDMFYKTGLFKNFGRFIKKRLPVPEFLFDKVVHHQACNLTKKRLQYRCFNVNFAKLLKAPWFLIFPNHFLFLMDARNKSIWFYAEFLFKQAPFLTSYSA